jgi:non-ribosomal peptide synthetase-like protein
VILHTYVSLLATLKCGATFVPLDTSFPATRCTPLLRLFGAHIGTRVYMETTFVTEFDLVRVGPDAMIAGVTSLQTHLVEDRVMKMSTVTVGPGCTVGPRCVVLYDAELADGANLEAPSLAMKGEMLPAQTRWRGIPAQFVE